MRQGDEENVEALKYTLTVYLVALVNDVYWNTYCSTQTDGARMWQFHISVHERISVCPCRT